jgi:hypothetical protein
VSVCSDFIENFLDKALNKYPNFIPRLKLMDKKAAIPLLRNTFLPIPTNLIRTIHPDAIKKHARLFDDAVFEAYKHVANDDGLLRSNYEFSAPFRLGGQGFRSLEKTSAIAYFSSVLNAANVLRALDPGIIDIITHCKENTPQQPYSQQLGQALGAGIPALLVEAWEVAQREIFAVAPSSFFPASVPELLHAFATDSICVDKLQHVLTAEAENAWDVVAKAGKNQEEVARNNANAIRGASSLFSACPTSAYHTMPTTSYEFYLKARTGTFRIPELMCVCGACELSLEHIYSCKKLRGRFIRHDVVVALVASMFQAAGMVARTEVRVVRGTQKRMDVVVYTTNAVYWIDVSLVNPLARSYVRSTDCIAEREKMKRDRWGAHAEQLGVVFLPFCLNVFGGLGAAALSVIQMVASRAFINYPYAAAASPGKWMAAHRAESAQRVAAAVAHVSCLSVEEAVVVAQGMQARGAYKGVKRFARVTT